MRYCASRTASNSFSSSCTFASKLLTCSLSFSFSVLSASTSESEGAPRNFLMNLGYNVRVLNGVGRLLGLLVKSHKNSCQLVNDSALLQVLAELLLLRLSRLMVSPMYLSLIHICRCRRIERCRSRWSPYH
eukprot:TRINITY_DN2301_c0_g1_i8.p1 TRINITY_DN2301_c0_g1~~TRINITY_DN2301_c0_g1_i8.p1  ORF type:complete len:131 (+),score=8.34 TRINITY_DN2301_c0_g1_i8:163-555(+)